MLYLFHGGGNDQDFITFDRLGIRGWTAGKPIIVVMPDGGHAGWYSNPVSSNTGPRDWANLSSAAMDVGGGTVYGAPLWDEARVSADNPVQRVESYRNKRVFLVAGTSPDPVNWFDQVNETQVLAGQREFRAVLDGAGIPHEWHEEPGGHFVREHMMIRDLDGIIARLRKA